MEGRPPARGHRAGRRRAVAATDPAGSCGRTVKMPVDQRPGSLRLPSRSHHIAEDTLDRRSPAPEPEHEEPARFGRDSLLQQAVSQLGVAVHVAVAAAAVGRVHDPDGVEIGIELLGDDCRQPSVNPLAHLDLAREHDDGSVAPDRFEVVAGMLDKDPRPGDRQYPGGCRQGEVRDAFAGEAIQT